MKELIERLRYPVLCTLDDRLEAADALERLTAELEATKKAVQQKTVWMPLSTPQWENNHDPR